MFMGSPQRNQSEDIIDKVAILTINVRNENDIIDKVVNLKINVGNENNLVNKVENLTINFVNQNDIINKVVNMKINDVGNDLNQANVSDIQVQFADDMVRKTHQNLFSSRMICI